MVLSKSKKKRLWEESNFTCAYCGEPIINYNRNDLFIPPDGATVDHVIPISKGGGDSVENLRASCFACNLALGNRLFNGSTVEEIFSNKKGYIGFINKKHAVKCHFCGKKTYTSISIIEWNGHWACRYCHYIVLGYPNLRKERSCRRRYY